MTLQTTIPLAEYVENGVTLAHAIPFQFEASSDIVCSRILDGVETLLTLGAHYTVAGGAGATGTVTKMSGGTVGTVFRIKRRTTRGQPTDYTPGDAFPAETHEAALDRIAAVNQEQDVRLDDVETRAVRVPVGEIAPLLPTRAARAGNYLAFDASGNPLPASGTGNDPDLRTDLVAPTGGTLVAVRSGSLQAALDSLGALASGYVQLADGDDIGPAIQRAIDAGHDDIILLGHNWLRSPVVSDRVIRLWGNGWEESATPGEGTWLLIDDDGFDPFTYTGTAAKGFQMLGIAFWQDHPAVGPGWTPTDYPPVISATDTAGGCYLDQIFFANINKWVRSVGAGRTSWGRIVGMPLRYGFYIDNALDACHGGSIHAWPFGYVSDPNYGLYVGAWTTANADLFVLGRVDTPQTGDIFALGCRSVFKITETASGVPTKIGGGIVNADSCKYVFYDPDGVGAPDGAQGWDFSFASITHQALKPGILPPEPIAGARFIYSTSDFVNGQVGTYFGEWHDRHDVEASGASFALQIGNYKSDFGNQDNGGYGRFLLTGTNALVQIGRVDLQGTPVGPLNDPSSTQNIEFAGTVAVKPGHNHNDVRSKRSSDGVGVGNTSKVMNHGLARTPTFVTLSPRTSPPASGVSDWWEDSAARTSTTITVRTNAAVSTTALFFDFEASCD